jgi:hypothetical protein
MDEDEEDEEMDFGSHGANFNTLVEWGMVNY